jgi:hypothetical protein
MANIVETVNYDSGVYLLATTDPVLGGTSGKANAAATNLANRTAWLKSQVDTINALTPTLAPLLSPTLTGTPKTAAPLVGDNSTQIASTAFVQIAANGRLALNVAGSANVTLSATQAGYAYIEFVGALTGNITVTVPGASSLWKMKNSTSGPYTITIISATSGGSTLLLPQGGSQDVLTDGQNVYSLGYAPLTGAVFTGAITVPGETNSGNLTFSGAASRILGDFTNATLASRLMLQTSTANSATSVGAIPSGTAIGANFVAYSASDPTNGSRVLISAIAGEGRLMADAVGTGTVPFLTLYTNAAERMRIGTAGRVLIGTTTDDGASKLQVNGVIATNGGLNVTGAAGSTFSGGITATGGWIELGPTTGVTTPFIDFHSSGSANDFDSRIIASGGTSGTSGLGTLQFQVGQVVILHGSLAQLKLASGTYQPVIRSNLSNSAIEFVNGANSAVNLTLSDAGYLTTRSGMTVNGAVTATGGVYVSAGNTITFQAQNGYTGTLRADTSSMVGFINQAGNAWNLQIQDAGTIVVRANLAATSGEVRGATVVANNYLYAGGGTSYISGDGNVYGTQWGGWLSNKLGSMVSDTQNRVPIRNTGYGGYGFVINNSGNAVQMSWGSNVDLSVDSTYIGAVITHSTLMSWLASQTGANGVGSYALTNTPNLSFGTNYSGGSVGLAAGTWTCMNGFASQGNYFYYLMFRRS